MIGADCHAIVTGGGTGVGAAIAHALANAGARVTILGRTEATLTAQGLPWQLGDVTDAASVAQAFDAARERQGPITAVIANAGVAISAPFERMRPDDFTELLAVNLTGVVNVWQAALPDMRKAGTGRLIAIASTAGLKGYPYVSGYCAAKHGVVGLTRSLALELATSGITVNAVCPGFIDTPLLRRSLERIVEATGQTLEQAEQALRCVNPQRRFIEVEEVAGAVLWLCSTEAAAMNGHALSLSGGET